MRVLFLTHRVPYAPNRGDRIRAFHVLRFLRAQGVPVCVVALAHDDEEEASGPSLTPLCDEYHLLRVPRTRNWRRAVFGLLGSTPLTHILLDAPGIRTLLKRVRDEWKPDVVLAYCSGMARYAVEPPLRGLPFVLDMVDVDSIKWRDLAARSAWPLALVYRREARLLGRFEARASKAAVYTTVVADRERVALAAIAPAARTSVVPNGIDLHYFRPPAGSAPERAVVFTGVFDYAPNDEGARWLIGSVWPAVQTAVPGAKLFLVGRGPSRGLRRAATAASHVHVVGAVPDVRPFLWSSRLAVAPLFVSRGLQNKVLEAIAAGLTVVTTPAVVDGLPDAARAGVHASSDATSFASAIVSALHGEKPVGPAVHLPDWNETLRPLSTMLSEAGASR